MALTDQLQKQGWNLLIIALMVPVMIFTPT